jgi:tetratricopeptide (TPR) repeat protein
MMRFGLFLFMFLNILNVNAQTEPILDKEKLYDFYQSQRYLEAAQYLNNVFGDLPKDQKVVKQIAYAYLMAGNNVEAEKYYLLAKEREPQNLTLLFSLASIQIKRGQYEQAKFYYSEIIKIDSNNFNGYKQIAGLYELNESLKQVYLEKANRINITDGDVAYDLALIYQQKKNNEGAYLVLNQAIYADTGNLILQKAKLPVTHALKKYSEVVESAEKILQRDQDPKVMKNLGQAYYELKEYQKAIDNFKTLENLELQSESSLYYATLCYRALKDYKMAGIYAQKTIEQGISSNTADYYTLLGLIYEENNQTKLSSTAYKKGLQFKHSTKLYYRLALLYDLKLNDKKNALNYYQLYLKNKPYQEKEKEEIAYTKHRIDELIKQERQK